MGMKIVVAFDAFKGCLSAEEACKAAAGSIYDVCPEADVSILPLSDGGEGLTACIRRLLPVAEVVVPVHGPLMDRVDCTYALSMDGSTAYMEMAAASGLTLVPPQKRNPLKTTTYGVGEMIADALRRGCRRIVMGIGGSATCDGGEGMLKALSDAGCLDRCLATGRGQGAMISSRHDDARHNASFDKGRNAGMPPSGNHTACEFVVACDVDNPLYGHNGAACVFAPQKGATPEQVAILDKRLQDFAHRTEKAGIATPRMAQHPGAGAAGGLGYALLAYLHAELLRGIDIVLDIADFDTLIRDADIVITGEGKSDAQTMMGKVACGVQERCARANVPVWLLSGDIDDAGSLLSRHFDRVCCINENDARPLWEMLQPEVAKENIGRTVKRLLQNTIH